MNGAGEKREGDGRVGPAGAPRQLTRQGMQDGARRGLCAAPLAAAAAPPDCAPAPISRLAAPTYAAIVRKS